MFANIDRVRNWTWVAKLLEGPAEAAVLTLEIQLPESAVRRSVRV
jgi:hypothetical protein